ncbi:MAG TPA: AAA family ATPase [Candidatus Acidoferrales bacterium]|nr:AAA family ATPase [Candidatus Acidoferrales bacterium]
MARGFIDGEYEDSEIRGLGLVIGVRGYGKTTEVARMTNGTSGRAWFIDTLGTHDHLFRAVTVHQPGELRAAALKGQRRIRYVPLSGDLKKHFEAICKLAMSFGNLVVTVDELDKYCSEEYGRRRMSNELNDVVQYGRHRRVAMLGVTRVPQDIAKGYRSQCERLLLFHTDEADHLAAVRESGCPQEIVNKLTSLPKYKYLQWQRGVSGAVTKGKVRKI